MGDNGVKHPVDQGHIGPWLLLEPEIGIIDQLNSSGVSHDELGFLLTDRFLYLKGDDRMVLGRI